MGFQQSAASMASWGRFIGRETGGYVHPCQNRWFYTPRLF